MIYNNDIVDSQNGSPEMATSTAMLPDGPLRDDVVSQRREILKQALQNLLAHLRAYIAPKDHLQDLSKVC